MKRSRLSYDEWTCILSKEQTGRQIESAFFTGYIGFIQILEVSKDQIWHFNGDDITVCGKGLKWLSILPQDEFYCITAMMNPQDKILLWYIDMIAGQGIDPDGIPYFDDLYLDLVVYPDGTVIVDDRDELEEALAQKDISMEQYQLALRTCDKLKNGLLQGIAALTEYTQNCYKLISPHSAGHTPTQQEE